MGKPKPYMNKKGEPSIYDTYAHHSWSLSDIRRMQKDMVDIFKKPDPHYARLIREMEQLQRRFRKNQSGILYILVTIVLFLFVIGFVWFAAWAIMSPINATIEPVAESYYDESWPLWTQFQYALTFMTNFWTYLLALAFFGLVFWVYMYSQHRGQAY